MVQTGPPTDKPVVYRLLGNDYTQLIAVSTAIKDRLATFPELYDIVDNLEGGTPELRIEVDREKAARYGLTPQSVGIFIRNSFDGMDAGTLFRDNQDIDILVRYDQSSIDSVAQLRNVQIPTPSGAMVPFSSLASINQTRAFNLIRRYDGKREITIEAESTQTDDLRRIDNTIDQLFRTELAQRYPDIELNIGGQFAEFLTLLFDILVVLSIGLFLIYTILGAQFKSYTKPILIIFAVPFAFVGVILFLVLTGIPVSIPVVYASVALAGIAVNDSIVLISFLNELRAEGKSPKEAIIEAAKTRLRPIILTSLTTIAGLLPTAIGIGGRSVVWGPMAGAIIFGLFFSTSATLIIIPCIYGIFYDRRPRKKPKQLDEQVMFT